MALEPFSIDDHRYAGAIQAEEFSDAETKLICAIQRNEFPEYTFLEKKKVIPATSQLGGLAPFLDEEGLMRVRGRICHADRFPFDTKYPIILP